MANPDIVIYRDGVALLVGDVKYKLHYTREDLNQVISYALSFAVNEAVVFVPALSEADAGLTTVGRIKGIQIHQYALWLGSVHMSEEAERMATAISAILPSIARVVNLAPFAS